MNDPVIIGAVRTAIGKFNGAFTNISAPELGALVIKETIKRSDIAPQDVDEVIMGNVIQAGLGQNPARQATLFAELPPTTPAFTVNKVCGSGLKAVILAAQAVKLGDADIVVAGGMENMTRAPYLLDQARSGYRLGDGKLKDAMVCDGLWDVYNDFHMAMTAELIAERYHISREEQDAFALNSNQKAIEAATTGQFDQEILPVTVKHPKKGRDFVFVEDESPIRDTSLDTLAGLPTPFKKDGTITAGNASSINDGAAALVVTSAEKADELGIPILARIRGYASAGVAPEMVMMSPVPAVENVLVRTNMELSDIDLIELNEAFAVQGIAVSRELGLRLDTVNVNGGAVALGHPIGASGARILVTLIYAMQNRNANTGMATLCMGGGNGLAMILEK
jgi:acetyl-CoA C-acetyltransferase